ncbi:tetratricopeptide repeat protein [Pseudochryseolinea flava]|nr:tetratricopeptide repeat protein [Pseudochryseolinea flava]
MQGLGIARRFFFVVLALVTVHSLNAQQLKVDSLITEVNNRSGNGKAKPLIELGILLAATDTDSSLQCFRNAYRIARRHGDTVNLVRSGRLLAEVLRRSYQLDSGLYYLDIILPIAQRNSLLRDLKYAYNSQAIIYSQQSRFDDALNANFLSLRLREAERDHFEISTSLNNIGLLYHRLHNFEYALRFFLRALAVKKSIPTTVDLDQLLMNIGLCFEERGDHIAAIKYTREGIGACGVNCAPAKLMIAYYNISLIHFNTRDLDVAEDTIHSALEIAKSNGLLESELHAENLLLLGRISDLKNKIDVAMRYFDAAQAVATSNGYNTTLLDIYGAKAKLYEKTHQYEQMSFYQKKYIITRDSIIGYRMMTNLIRIENDYITQTKNNQIEAYQKSIADKDDHIRQKNALIIVSVVAALLFVAVSALIFKMYRRKDHDNRRLDRMVSERTQQLVELNNRTQSCLNSERLSFAKRVSEVENLLVKIDTLCAMGQRQNRNEYLDKIKSAVCQARLR